MNIKKGFGESQDFLISILNGIPYGAIILDSSGKMTMANEQTLDCLSMDMSLEKFIRTNILEIFGRQQDLYRALKICLTKNLVDFDVEEVLFHDKYLTFRGRVISEGMIITIADITAVKLAEFDALNSLLEGQEMERKRIAQEIHDGIGPMLSTVKMKLSAIESDTDEIKLSLKEKFEESYEMIDEAANDLRSISHNLLPKVLTDFGLTEALETLCEKLDATKKISVQLLHSNFDDSLDKVTELGLYRICQELINNSLKHSHASKLTLQLIKREKIVMMMYEDDGRGFSPETVKQGLGLMNIENRAKALAGEILIDSQPEKGMTATLEIPIDITKT